MKFVSKLFYRWMRAWVKLTLRLFYVKIEVSGTENLRRGEAQILLANHQNTLIDALLLVCFCPIKHLHFLARADIFSLGNCARKLLRFFKISPVYRPSDGMAAFKNIDKVWEQSRALLQSGKSICLFPEGTHKNAYTLRPFKKGYLRLAKASGIENMPIVPVCLHYQKHFTGLSKVWIEILPPVQYTEGCGEKIHERFARNLVQNDNADHVIEQYNHSERLGLNFSDAVKQLRAGTSTDKRPKNILWKIVLLACLPLFILSSFLFVPLDLIARFLSSKMQDKQFSLSIQMIIKWLFYSIAALIYLLWELFSAPYWYESILVIVAWMVLGKFHKEFAYKFKAIFNI